MPPVVDQLSVDASPGAHGRGAGRVEVDDRSRLARPADGDGHDVGVDLLGRALVERPGPVAVGAGREAEVDDGENAAGRTDVVEVLRLDLPEDSVGTRPFEDDGRGARVALRERQRDLVRRRSREREDGRRGRRHEGIVEPRPGRRDVAVLHPHPELVDAVGRVERDGVAHRGRLRDDLERRRSPSSSRPPPRAGPGTSSRRRRPQERPRRT